MKFKLPMGVCVLIAIVLVLFGLGMARSPASGRTGSR